MGSLSNYAEAKLIDHMLRTASFSVPSNIYVALSTADPLDDGSGMAEPSGGNYSRVQCNAWNAAASRAAVNTNVVTFPKASASWGLTNYFAIFDAITSGNLLGSGSITSGAFTPIANDTPYIPAGQISLSFSTGGLSTYAANKLLDHLLKTSAYTQPTHVYAGLSTANPGDSAGSLAEPSGNSYARVLHDVWAAVTGGATSNTGTVTFPEATGNWGTLSHSALFDALSSGNMLAYGALAVAKAIINGQIMAFESGDIDITID